jgi:hypothetical protein
MQEEEKQAKEWQCEFPLNISDNPEFKAVVNLLDYGGDGKHKTCGRMAGVTRQQGYP